jgi:hypothetical protein
LSPFKPKTKRRAKSTPFTDYNKFFENKMN